MRRVYARLGSSCPRLHTLGLGQSFFFQRGLISDLNTVLAKVTLRRRMTPTNITLPQLPGLTTLKLHYVGVDGMLDNIAQLCPRLRSVYSWKIFIFCLVSSFVITLNIQGAVPQWVHQDGRCHS